MKNKCELVWEKCLLIIKDNINLQSYKTWFEPIKPVNLEKDVITIQVPSQFFYEWLEEHYVTLLRKTIKRIIGETAKLEYQIVMDNNSQNGKSGKPAVIKYPNYSEGAKKYNEMNTAYGFESPMIKNPFVIPGLKKISVDSQLNPNYTFESYIEGDCNRLARSAGIAVSKAPGATAFNPLVLYGGVGLGKTHLAQAIGNYVKAHNSNKVVLYVSSEKFTNQFIDALKNNSVNDFVHFYQVIDVLIIDDIQFFSNKAKTQDIFFHIFNHLHQSGKQLILTSDRPPKDLEGMEERLLSRFKWGLSADLSMPDFETRIAILENKMNADGILIPKEVVEFVAYNIKSNIRELEGVLISLLAQSSLTKQDITIDLAKKIVANFVKSVSKEISIDTIQKVVCEHLEIPLDKLKAKTRKREVVQARQLSMFFAKEFTNSSLKAIGGHFGGRDHSTVIHSCQAVKNLVDTDEDFRDTVEELKKRIQLTV
ncbi:MAG: chromosomal replication initiator protein DnaA [Bacteroidetes bacterium]|nr:chromosomal replication initiator protein DnaA [Bacteroidota bacterium]